MTTTIPRWYVREDTLAGPMYFYPRQTVKQSDFGPRRDCTWSVEPASAAPVELVGDYVVTREPVTTLIASWTNSPRVAHYELRPMDDIDRLAQPLAERVPEVVTPEEYTRERCQSKDNCGECLWCSFRDKLYQRVMAEPTTDREVFDVAGLLELPAVPDLAPNWPWVVDSPPLAALYPSRAAHLLAGYTRGLFDAVAAEVRDAMGALALPKTDVYVWSNSNEISVSCMLPWDQPRDFRPVGGRGKEARRRNSELQSKALYGMNWRERVRIPDRVAGDDKAAAMATVGRLVAEYANKLVPPHTQVCGSCSGRGYTA